MLYAITDIESTGGTKGTDKITEIAIYLFDGEKIVNQFHTLVNPQRTIQPFVVKLTGITDDMVKDAPTFPEVAKDIVEITEGAIFVAHNVSFDYTFLRSEFKSLGFDFNRKRLCTVNLSRKIIPGRKSYSLGKLTDDLGIGLNGRHRADGDALATVELFKVLLENDDEGLISLDKTSAKHKSNIPIDTLSQLPMDVGVYYLYNKENDIIYIGKSKNIHDRIFSHIGNVKTKKAIQMAEEIVDVTFELTGSDLVAQLHESFEIKKHQPKYDVAQSRVKQNFGIFSEFISDNYYEIRVKKIVDDSPLIGFSTKRQADKFLNAKVHEYNLCNCLTGISSRGRSCLHHQMNLCKGAGVKQETKENYNKKVVKMLASISFEYPNFMILCEGRAVSEKGVVLIENGVFKGFGFVKKPKEEQDYINCITPEFDNSEVRKIIQQYLRNVKEVELVTFKS